MVFLKCALSLFNQAVFWDEDLFHHRDLWVWTRSACAPRAQADISSSVWLFPGTPANNICASSSSELFLCWHRVKTDWKYLQLITVLSCRINCWFFIFMTLLLASVYICTNILIVHDKTHILYYYWSPPTCFLSVQSSLRNVRNQQLRKYKNSWNKLKSQIIWQICFHFFRRCVIVFNKLRHAAVEHGVPR